MSKEIVGQRPETANPPADELKGGMYAVKKIDTERALKLCPTMEEAEAYIVSRNLKGYEAVYREPSPRRESAKRQAGERIQVRLPKEFRYVLIEADTTFNQWCDDNGFNRATARYVASGVLHGVRGKSKAIRIQLEKDFPSVYGRGKR